jgi:hypothetical protein
MFNLFRCCCHLSTNYKQGINTERGRDGRVWVCREVKHSSQNTMDKRLSGTRDPIQEVLIYDLVNDKFVVIVS